MNKRPKSTKPESNISGGDKENDLRNAELKGEGVVISYGSEQAVKGVDIVFPSNKITAVIGPSGCGKSTLLRAFNRMNDFILGAKVEGSLMYKDMDLYDKNIDPVEVRLRIGMVFQKPNPFPKTIFKNIAWAPQINGYTGDIAELVETSLKRAALWNEVSDRLHDSALGLSGGQQQRLCIARSLAMKPEVLLMDEPCSALDPVSTSHIEDLMLELKEQYTIVIVTHNMQQAARVSDYTAFMDSGNLVEFDETSTIFTNPKEQRTEDYVSGRFG
ncbi:MAG: phosphate ABC transporter ATP-binding protein [Planctomycetia bacterium]|nr:phosphate ABC transporter ATP-binding protein [Planctomycetia bacterium]MBL6914420.1 phosphate ABC transporter ATP-binding protein [Planctomycetota bacterium]